MSVQRKDHISGDDWWELGGGQEGGGSTYPSPAARTCSCRRDLPAPPPQGRTGLETPGTRFHEP